VPLSQRLPRTIYPFGTGRRIDYDSDKRDPGSPQGRGKRGHLKKFTHAHSPGVAVYASVEGVSDHRGDGEAISWPTTAVRLGTLSEYEYVCVEDSKVRVEKYSGWGLWASEDGEMLFAFPEGRIDETGPITDLLVWRGGSLRVTGRGIEH